MKRLLCPERYKTVYIDFCSHDTEWLNGPHGSDAGIGEQADPFHHKPVWDSMISLKV